MHAAGHSHNCQEGFLSRFKKHPYNRVLMSPAVVLIDSHPTLQTCVLNMATAHRKLSTSSGRLPAPRARPEVTKLVPMAGRSGKLSPVWCSPKGEQSCLLPAKHDVGARCGKVPQASQQGFRTLSSFVTATPKKMQEHVQNVGLMTCNPRPHVREQHLITLHGMMARDMGFAGFLAGKSPTVTPSATTTHLWPSKSAGASL